MMGFSNTWRKRLACERCRHLKVRCEYASPTNDTCIRCEKSKATCIIASPKRKNGSNQANDNSSHMFIKPQEYTPSPESSSIPVSLEGESNSHSNGHTNSKAVAAAQDSKEEHAVYLQRIIMDAKRKLADMNVSPLSQALSAGIYTLDEAQTYYNLFLENPSVFPLISLLDLPRDIRELDKDWPWLTISIVSSRALNTTTKSLTDIMIFLQDLLSCDFENFGYRLTLDRFASLALICQYALIFREDRGLATLFYFHSMTIATMRKFHTESMLKEEKIVLHLGALTILPFTAIKRFAPLNQVTHYYHTVMNYGIDAGNVNAITNTDSCECVADPFSSFPMSTSQSEMKSPHVFTSGLLMEMLLGYNRAVSIISSATDIWEISGTMESSLQSISLLENQSLQINVQFCQAHGINPENLEIPVCESLTVSPWRCCYVMIKMKIIKLAVVRMLDLSFVEGVGSEKVTTCLQSAISQGANFSSQLFRIFAYADSQWPYLPTVMFYYVPEALISLQLMRFAAFAGAIDIDVRSDCLTEVVLLKWEELVRTSGMIRQLFMLLFPVLETANVKIGEASFDDAVVGSGNMREFNIIFCEGSIKKIREQFRITRESFREIIQGEYRKAELGNDSASWFEKVDTLSLPTVIHLLLFRL